MLVRLTSNFVHATQEVTHHRRSVKDSTLTLRTQRGGDPSSATHSVSKSLAKRVIGRTQADHSWLALFVPNLVEDENHR